MEMAVVSMEKPSGHFPLRRGKSETPVPGSWPRWWRTEASYQELKSQLIQLGLDHAKALKAAEADAAAKMDEALEDASNATVVLRAELEELAKPGKVPRRKPRGWRSIRSATS
ncbi:hypothetical protein QYE76_018315 [Lolium multiflorum]|uniref:Uncharacterized protein n=1 Tax=Lolium multiflorum TaxID=4521 RepID=A0AAD8QGW7_LOLMU|nr:hypothetical protein QYE76_018315 [Lolium multiflorum]